MTLATRTLAGLEISTVGFGAWAISGTGWKFAWGPQDDLESIAAIRHAVESGVNWIDTAPVYGLGHSEEVVGAALRALPEADRPFVFTKAGLVWDDADPLAPPRKILDPKSVRRELEDSLRRLGVERIDLYQAHWPGDGLPLDFETPPGTPSPDAVPLAEYWATFAELRQEGKVGAIALSNHGADRLAEADTIAHVDAIQPQFSLLSRGAAPDLAWAARNGSGAIVYQPMHSGLLSGEFSADRVAALPDTDWRRTAPDFTTGLERNLSVARALGPVAERHGVPVAAVAVAWTLAWEGVTGAIVGARRPEQVDGWLPAASLELTGEDLDEIAAALTRTGAGEGPVHPRGQRQP
ncbi:aldo/keto reductase [Nocardiopsis terrae]